MQVTETLNEGLKRKLSVVIPKTDLTTRLDARLGELKDRALEDLGHALEAICSGRRYIDPALARAALTASTGLQIATALADIYQRLMRVRSIAPTVDVSDRMWELMSMVGLKAKPVRSASFRSAASFL